MGQCYYVECKVKIKNEANIVEALQRFMETRDANFNLENFASRGIANHSCIRDNNLSDCMLHHNFHKK